MLGDLVVKVLEFLRSRIDHENPNCPFKEALERAFNIAALNEDERNQVILDTAVAEWNVADVLQQRLSSQYAQFLNIDVEGEADDLLVWNGIDVVSTYADPNVEPSAEHFALAALIKEGMVSELASANWDELVERAVKQTSADSCGIDVCVRSEDLQESEFRAKLLKFHGCAVRAGQDEETYRQYIVGRQVQIDTWRDEPRNQGMVQHLVTTIMENPTLMLGLSAQDFNIRGLFSQAQNQLAWNWPGDRPACVFSNNEIGEDQRALLGNVFRQHYTGQTRSEIQSNVLVRSYASQLLPALLLYGLARKLTRISSMLPMETPEELGEWVEAKIAELRNAIAAGCTADTLSFVLHLMRQITKCKSLLIEGRSPEDPACFEPITETAVRNIEDSQIMRNSGLPEAAVAAAIVGAGSSGGLWEIAITPEDGIGTGMISLVLGDRSTPLYVVTDAIAENHLFASGHLKESKDAIVVHAKPIHDRMQRSPSRSFSRTSADRIRRTSIRTLLGDVANGEGLIERFCLEAMP
ncbi:SIR2 family protein [Ruegeria sp. HKCCC2117]|uniref:SIR2 family protein n=1 Tax=Ruegeria sp. HKCCC2117 TaxID=2682992 RepID=UPI001489167D|nr:SIR2 family protein [Ruegeria sp. HKCCC2117]